MKPICGIDYGSKLAGTTALATLCRKTGNVTLLISQKKQDADAFITKALEEIQPEFVFIDAPLSLPSVYACLTPKKEKPLKEDEPDFFYRKGDKILGAMSPLFLGGLTARAMRLVYQLAPLPFYETYPAWQAKNLGLNTLNYKKEIVHLEKVFQFIQNKFPDWQIQTPSSWHELDAILALIGAWHFAEGKHQVFGEAQEGQIYL